MLKKSKILNRYVQKATNDSVMSSMIFKMPRSEQSKGYSLNLEAEINPLAAELDVQDRGSTFAELNYLEDEKDIQQALELDTLWKGCIEHNFHQKVLSERSAQASKRRS